VTRTVRKHAIEVENEGEGKGADLEDLKEDKAASKKESRSHPGRPTDKKLRANKGRKTREETMKRGREGNWDEKAKGQYHLEDAVEARANREASSAGKRQTLPGQGVHNQRKEKPWEGSEKYQGKGGESLGGGGYDRLGQKGAGVARGKRERTAAVRKAQRGTRGKKRSVALGRVGLNRYEDKQGGKMHTGIG